MGRWVFMREAGSRWGFPGGEPEQPSPVFLLGIPMDRGARQGLKRLDTTDD